MRAGGERGHLLPPPDVKGVSMQMNRLAKQPPLPRGSGILLPVFSLPSPFGIGTLGKEARRFIKFLAASGQRYWQVLPIGPTSYGDSPYQSFSAFAGNPYFIDLPELVKQNLLTPEEVQSADFGHVPDQVDYEALDQNRLDLLRRAYEHSRHRDTPAYQAFLEENQFWLGYYSLFMALKALFGGREWLSWPKGVRLREPSELTRYREKLADEIDFWNFLQFTFDRQWSDLKQYANRRGVELMGDLPIYVAMDSADVWAHGELFQLDQEKRPVRVAGVPPDAFSETGQLWGNPLYRWDVMRKDDYAWWRKRIAFSAKRFDAMRIDHFIGIVQYYAIPSGEDTAMHGEWLPGPGEELIQAINAAKGSCRIVAEDLGSLTPQVRELLIRTGYPGMKVLEFAFDSGPDNEHLPCHYPKNIVAYCGTHDNDTLAGFFASKKPKELAFAMEYLCAKKRRELPARTVRALFASSADTVMLQMQDLLKLGSEARINTPSTLGNNWQWRMTPGMLTPKLAKKLRKLTRTYGRERKEEKAHEPVSKGR